MTAADDRGVVVDEDDRPRCYWCAGSEDLTVYHDTEWGFPVSDDRCLFEMLSLEGFQAGLSWLTILRKRVAFRAAFADFDFAQVAKFTEADVERLALDAGIVRSRAKIRMVINNARRALDLVTECGSLAAYVDRFRPTPESRPPRIDRAILRSLTTSPEAIAMASDLKRRGWTYVGPSTVYAFMQAVGLVDDHCHGCFVRDVIEKG